MRCHAKSASLAKRIAGGVALLALALAAPALAHKAQKPPPIPVTPLPASYLAAGSAQLPDAVLDQWWRLFRDPTLDGLEAEALAGSYDSRTAAARLLEARATRAADIDNTLPLGSIAAGASHQSNYALGVGGDNLNPTAGVTSTAFGDFNVSWEIDLFGRLATRRRLADADAAEARFNVEGVFAALVAEVADDYVQLKGLQAQIADARETLRIEADLLNVAQRKAAVGAGPDDAADRVSGQVAQASAQLATLQAQSDSIGRQLLILVGRDLRDTANMALIEEWPSVPPTPRALPGDLLNRRPDVREAEFRLRAQLGAAHLAHLAVFPTLTLLPGLGVSSTSAPGVSYIPPTTLITSQQVTTSGFWNIGAGLTVPTLDIPRLLQQARAEDARSREAAIAYERTVRAAFGEAQNALVSLRADEEASRLLDEGEARAARAYQASRRRYDHGLDDLTATLTAEQEWRKVRMDLTAQRTQTLRRAVTAYKALGGGWAYSGVPLTNGVEG